MKEKFFAVIKASDGRFEVIDHPDKLCGYRPKSVYLFGNAVSSKEEELRDRARVLYYYCDDFHEIR